MPTPRSAGFSRRKNKYIKRKKQSQYSKYLAITNKKNPADFSAKPSIFRHVREGEHLKEHHLREDDTRTTSQLKGLQARPDRALQSPPEFRKARLQKTRILANASFLRENAIQILEV